MARGICQDKEKRRRYTENIQVTLLHTLCLSQF